MFFRIRCNKKAINSTIVKCLYRINKVSTIAPFRRTNIEKLTSASIFKEDKEQNNKDKRKDQLKIIRNLAKTKFSISNIARKVQVPRQTVSTWLKKMENGEKIKPKGRPDLRHKVIRYLRHHFNPKKSVKEIQTDFINQFGPVSPNVIYIAMRFLKLKSLAKRTKNKYLS